MRSAVRVVSGPKLLALAGQRATIFIGETIRYARTEAAVNEAGGLEFSIREDPEGAVNLGEEIVVFANPTDDGRTISLDFTGAWREAAGDLSPEAVTGMSRADLMKRVRGHEVRSVFEMPSGSWVLLGSPDSIETDDAGPAIQVTLLHARVLEASDTARGGGAR